MRQNGEVTGMEQYSDKEHLSKLYVANGGGQSELEKQEHARLQKVCPDADALKSNIQEAAQCAVHGV